MNAISIKGHAENVKDPPVVETRPRSEQLGSEMRRAQQEEHERQKRNRAEELARLRNVQSYD